MTKTTKPGDAIRRGNTYVHNLGSAITLEAEVSPCVFMYPRYPLQVTVTLRHENDTALGIAFAVDRSPLDIDAVYFYCVTATAPHTRPSSRSAMASTLVTGILDTVPPLVRIVAPGVSREVIVQVGVTDGNETEIISGVNEGDQVALE